MQATAASLIYLAGLGLIVRRRAHRGRPTFVDLCLTYAPGVVWLAPLLWLVPAAIRSGSLGALALNLAALALVLVTLMDLRLFSPQRPAASGHRLRVATFNVFGGSIDITRCVAFLATVDADVIFLQEAWWTNPHRRIDTLPVIFSTFGDWHAFRSEEAHEMMILSRHPLASTREMRLANRPCIEATIATPAGEVRLINVHLDPPATRRTLRRSGKPVMRFLLDTEQARRRQGDALAALVRERDLPTVAAGDFNSPPHAYTRRVMQPLLVDVFEAAGRGFGYTYPQQLPLWRIDYVMASRHLVAERCNVVAVEGSDHLPLVADLRLGGPLGGPFGDSAGA